MLFTLDTPTEAKLETFTARTERHGKELVSALTLGLAITGPNVNLDLLAPGLRQALYERADDATEALDGIEPATTKLRTRLLSGPLAIAVPEIVGGTLYVEWGASEDDMSFGNCTLGKWRLEALDGGTCTLRFKVSTNDVSEEEAGHLFGKQGQTIAIRFDPPAPAQERVETNQTIDGTTGHPGASLFDGDPDETDSEGGEADATDTFVEQHGA